MLSSNISFSTLPDTRKVAVGDLTIDTAMVSDEEFASIVQDFTAVKEMNGTITMVDDTFMEMSAMTRIDGDLKVTGGGEMAFPNLVEVTGEVIVGEGSKLTAKCLRNVGSFITVAANASIEAPQIEEDTIVYPQALNTTLGRKMIPRSFA